jgi:class 3 adenylate cyclase
MNEQDETLEQWAGTRDSKATLALVFTDIVNSTLIGRRLGDDRWIPIVIKHFEQARHLKDKHNGYLIKVIGDACMVAFRTTVAAFRFATDFYADTGASEIRIRAGIHFGHVWIIDNDIYGSMVNLTSRIQHLVESNGIAISDPATNDIKGVLGVHARRMRFNSEEHDIKGFGKQTIWRVMTYEMAQADGARAAASKPATPPSVLTRPSASSSVPTRPRFSLPTQQDTSKEEPKPRLMPRYEIGPRKKES